MFMRKFLIFTVFCLGINICQAAKYVTFDSVALETAMNEIKTLGSDSVYSTIEDAGETLYEALYDATTDEDMIDSTEMMDTCVEIIEDAQTCIAFINTYRKYLDHANYCKQANKFKAGNFTFEDCNKYVTKDDTSYASRDSSGKIYRKCQQWLETGIRCNFYLISYYTDKLDNSGLSASNKKYYECLLNKVENGDMNFPISKMEKSCK